MGRDYPPSTAWSRTRPQRCRRPGAIADQALLCGTGARGLRAILEEVLLPVMYEAPSRKDVERVVITRKAVLENVNPTIVPKDVTRRTPPREVRLTGGSARKAAWTRAG